MYLKPLSRLRVALVCLTAAAMAATSASAQVTTFATFAALNSAKNVRLVNSGNSAARTTDARIFTTSVANGTTPSSIAVKFSFLQPGLSSFVNDIVANYTLDATISKGNSGGTFGNVIIQPTLSGTMSFLSTTSITLTGPSFSTHTYAAGSNLLTVVFDGYMTGGKNGSQATLAGSTDGGNAVTFTSDFLDFSNVNTGDLTLGLTALSAKLALGTGANKSLQSFNATAGGQFSSDPAPAIVGLIPEPVSWVMMVTGFGMLGVALRRHTQVAQRTV